MKFNVFEGARRIALLLQIAFVLVALGIGFFSDPYVRLIYETRYPNEPFSLAKNQDCDYVDDKSESIERKTEEGKEINITLCYRGSPFSGGDILIPYKLEDDGKVWGNSKYSTEVSDYTKKRTAFFSLPPEAQNEYQEVLWKKRFDNIWGGIKVAVIGYFSILIFSFVMGWIVRGFFGIPSGADHRQPEIKSE
jgi:hypothetical protein